MGRVVLGIHPYAQDSESIKGLIAEVRRHWAGPIFCDEWGIPRGPIPEVAAKHSALLEAMWRLGIEGTCVFPLSSAMHPGFDGLVDDAGTPNEIFAAVSGAAAALAGPPPVEQQAPTVVNVPGNVAGRFATTPNGIILHATRSGKAWSEREEFDATIRFVEAGANELGWNCTVAAGMVGVHITPDRWGWNAREHSDDYLAIEFAQARLGDPISDAAVDAAAYWIREYALARWPDLPLNFVHHASLPAGKRDGKTDIYPDGDPEQQAFIQRLRARL